MIVSKADEIMIGITLVIRRVFATNKILLTKKGSFGQNHYAGFSCLLANRQPDRCDEKGELDITQQLSESIYGNSKNDLIMIKKTNRTRLCTKVSTRLLILVFYVQT